jgi:hypothetical protein
MDADNAKGNMGIGTEGEWSLDQGEDLRLITSINSTSKIARIHSKPRDSESRSCENPEYADKSLQDM